MLRRFSINFALFSIAVDAALVAITLHLAVLWRPRLNDLPFVQQLEAGNADIPNVLYFVFPLIWVLVLLLFSVYDGRRNLRVVDEMSSLVLGCALAGIASAGALYLSYRDVSRLQFLLFAAMCTLGLVTWRLAMRGLIRWRGLPTAQRRILVVGAGDTGQQVKQQIEQHARLGLVFLGFLDDERNAESVIGYLDDVRQVVQDSQADDVVIALPSWAYQRVSQLAAELHDLPVRTWVIPDYFSLALHRAQIDDFAGLPLLDLRAPALSDYQRLVKRAFDIVLILLTLPVWLPLIAIVALIVRIADGSPVFLRQRRVGENGRVFQMVKFRTMVPDAELVLPQDDSLLHKRRDDPRVTRVGRFLRHTSIDELPQLWNVLKGEMSLVGPRPELPELVERYELWQRKRFAIPQGITGWWQINGRSDKPMHLHTEEDLYYVQNYSLGLDIFILLRTAWTVLSGRGAF